jgi:hypothetical protein
MAPVRQDSPHRPGHILNGQAPGAPASRPAPALEQPVRPASAPAVRDGFEAPKARGLRAAGDGFDAGAALGPRQKRAHESLAPDQRTRFDTLLGTAQSDPHRAKAVKQVQGLLGPGGGFKHYDLVDKALTGKADSQGALRQLLFNGKLTQGKTPLHQNALEHLGMLAAQPKTATGLDSHALLSDVVLDLARPERIKQGPNNADCGGTAAAVILSKTKPAEYARIVTELGTKGAATVGDQLWTASPLKDKAPGGERSLSQRLFAATYVQQTNDPTIQPTTDAQVQGLLNGEYGREMANGLRKLTGRNYQAAAIPSAAESNLVVHRAAVSEALTAIAQHLKIGAPIALNVDNHWVVATGAIGPKGSSLIHVADGSGKSREIPVRQLRDSLQGFVFDNAVSNVPADMRFLRKFDKPGIGGDSTEGAQPVGSRFRN